MPYTLDGRLVIGLASSALFDLAESDSVFEEEGEEAYRSYQEGTWISRCIQGLRFRSSSDCSR